MGYNPERFEQSCLDEIYDLERDLTRMRLANLGAGLAMAGRLAAITAVIDYDLRDLPILERGCPGGDKSPHGIAAHRILMANFRARRVAQGMPDQLGAASLKVNWPRANDAHVLARSPVVNIVTADDEEVWRSYGTRTWVTMAIHADGSTTVVHEHTERERKERP